MSNDGLMNSNVNGITPDNPIDLTINLTCIHKSNKCPLVITQLPWEKGKVDIEINGYMIYHLYISRPNESFFKAKFTNL